MEATLVNILVRIVSVILVVSCALPAFAGESIKLGAILAETGPASFLGTPEAKTLRMLVEEINAKGGINGKKIELIIKDTGADPQKAVSFAKQLIDEEKVFAIIGPST
ncbi:MAG: ABC transporter substrate-binding protein, partial [Methylococcaceae bacterium]|nr:ABC transporter substrate-binding protein [Methylococcaceae bacterium]